MDAIDKKIINQFQGGVPVVDRPFDAIAKQLNISENEVMTRISFMLDDGLLTRFGPLFNIDKMGGTFSLCALQVPEEIFEQVAEQVNSLPEVAHNYEREHALNMWFVVAAESADVLDQVIGRIERMTGLAVFNFPKQQEFYVNLKLEI